MMQVIIKCTIAIISNTATVVVTYKYVAMVGQTPIVLPPYTFILWNSPKDYIAHINAGPSLVLIKNSVYFTLLSLFYIIQISKSILVVFSPL